MNTQLIIMTRTVIIIFFISISIPIDITALSSSSFVAPLLVLSTRRNGIPLVTHRRSNAAPTILLFDTSLCAVGDDPEDKECDNDDDIIDMKGHYLHSSSSSFVSDATQKHHDPPSSSKPSVILTTSRRRRLQREIQLLKQLDPKLFIGYDKGEDEYTLEKQIHHEEKIVSELWSLWYGERGPQNEKKLIDIEKLVFDGYGSRADAGDNNIIPPEWVEAEQQYLALIREHCSSSSSSTGQSRTSHSEIIVDANSSLNLSIWVEPANRLATLLFLMGRYHESKQWCERILSSKPWHVGALSGIVLVCANIGDIDEVTKYSKLALPQRMSSVSSLEWIYARSEWVRRNVELAETNLSQLEEMNKRSSSEELLSNDVANIGGFLSSSDGHATAGDGDDSSAWQ